jgi:uncharacterized alpha-E superfamily protein
VLSRLAEALYWAGRYVERAEDVARLLDVHFHILLEDRRVDEAAACHTLLEVMGAGDRAPAGGCDIARVSAILAYDRDSPASIVGALTAARENARGSRDAMSSEMWECLNATWHALPDAVEQASVAPHALFRFVKERAAAFAGMTESTMSRDEGWLFLVLGRSLERADMTTRLLSARYGETWGAAGWVATLRSCGAHEAYLRTYQRGMDAHRVAEFLLLDRLFPRSVFHAVTTAEQCLAELDPGRGRTGPHSDARRILGRARTELEFSSPASLLDDLPEHLALTQRACADAGDAVSTQWFGVARPVEWSA